MRLETVVSSSTGISSTQVPIANLGGLAGGETRIYQLGYRDAEGPCGNGYNLTHALELVWEP